MRISAHFLLVAAVLLFGGTAVFAQQPLIASAWYAVVYQPETDTLRWINAQGEQGQMPRPQLPNEIDYRDLRIAPDGRTMVMVSQLNTGSLALGVYDFAAGLFKSIHTAQPGESVELGGENIFSADSQVFAVGFFSGDFASPAWRVILFETQTGNAAAFIDGSHPDAPSVPLSAPAVQYIDTTHVHFQLIPQSVGGWHTWPAYSWRVFGYDPSTPLIDVSPYTRAEVQIQPLTGQVVMSYADPNFAAAPPSGLTPNFNAIGAGTLASGGALTPVHVDSSRFLGATRWAKGGDWILLQSEDSLHNRYWGAALANGTPGNNSYMPFDPQFTNVYGTGDGYLLVNNASTLLYTNGFMPNTAQNIAQLTPSSEVVYVTPIGATFALAQVPNNGAAQIVTPTQPVVIVPPVIVTPTAPAPVVQAACATALSPRVSVGGMARVVMTTPTLNVRQQPGGAILTTFGSGTTFYVIGGSACAQDLYWWQIERYGMVGWVAEGVSGNYLIEPYAGPMSVDPSPTPVIVVSPPPAELPPVFPPAQLVCGQALPPRLTIGGSATILSGSARPHNGPGGELRPLRFYPEGMQVTVNAGPECAGGQFWWLITGLARIGRVGQNFEPIQAWVPEGTDSAYYLSP